MTASRAAITDLPAELLVAPISGVVVPIEHVPDPVFSGKMLGDGIAIDPTEGLLKAPCAGTLTLIHRAKHAFTLTTTSGDVALLHVGVDTVKLTGEGFRPLVREGERVAPGQPLLEFDLDVVAQKAPSAQVVVLVTEGRTQLSVLKGGGLVTAGQDAIIRLGQASAAPSASAVEEGVVAPTEQLIIRNPHGLHARPAARLAARLKELKASVFLHKGKAKARATSVTELMALDLVQGDVVWLSAQGEQASQALQLAKDLIESGLGEDLRAAAPAAPDARFVSSSPDVLGGVAAAPGLAVGVVQLARLEVPAYEERASNAAAESAALARAVAAAVAELSEAERRFASAGEPEKSQIFAAHRELASDASLVEDTERFIAAGASAAASWVRATDERISQLAALKNPLMRQRADDLKDVRHRVLLAALGIPSSQRQLPQGTVLASEDLTPSDVAHLDASSIVAIASAGGGATSHAAIIARSMGVPYVAGLGSELGKLHPGARVIVDANVGFVRIDPSAADIAAAESEMARRRVEREERLRQATAQARTKDGKLIEVAANIGTVAEAEQVVAQGADGVGLLRSELMFMGRRAAPSEQEQAEALQRIAKALGPSRSLVVRTLDVGGDKPLAYMPLPAEDNPFLGIRGLRLSLRFPELFDAQLRAVLSAAPFAKLQIMFPMVSELDEFLRAKERVQALMPAGASVKVGVMIEVPSAALMADVLAEHADFFSIGTNDLTQYTLAMDRGHPELAARADALDPAVLRLIKMTADAGQRAGKWVGVCGGLAGEPVATPLLVGLGVTELSAPAPSAADIKAVVRSLDFTACQRLAEQALRLPSSRAVRALLAAFKG